jgi:hypothetical protein
MLDVWDEVIHAQVVTCDPGAAVMTAAAEGGKIWLAGDRIPEREAVIVKVDQDAWEITCVLPSGDCPWCGTPVNDSGQHLNAVIGSACERTHPRPPQPEEEE